MQANLWEPASLEALAAIVHMSQSAKTLQLCRHHSSSITSAVEGGHDETGVAGADLRAVLVEGDIADPAQGVWMDQCPLTQPASTAGGAWWGVGEVIR